MPKRTILSQCFQPFLGEHASGSPKRLTPMVLTKSVDPFSTIMDLLMATSTTSPWYPWYFGYKTWQTAVSKKACLYTRYTCPTRRKFRGWLILYSYIVDMTVYYFRIMTDRYSYMYHIPIPHVSHASSAHKTLEHTLSWHAEWFHGVLLS